MSMMFASRLVHLSLPLPLALALALAGCSGGDETTQASASTASTSDDTDSATTQASATTQVSVSVSASAGSDAGTGASTYSSDSCLGECAEDECAPECILDEICVGHELVCQCICPDTTGGSSTTTGAETTTGVTTAETTDATTDATDSDATSDSGGLEVMCLGDPPVFPTFDKSCSGDDDCVLVLHTIDCCGNSVAWGLNAGEQAAFDAAEAICDEQLPECDCPVGPTEAEDGGFGWPDEIQVKCAGDVCSSFIP